MLFEVVGENIVSLAVGSRVDGIFVAVATGAVVAAAPMLPAAGVGLAGAQLTLTRIVNSIVAENAPRLFQI